MRRASPQDQKEIKSGDYLREVIETYRLLFGQDKASWELFRARYRIRRRLRRQPPQWDPLLNSICGADWADQDIYNFLGSLPSKTVYSAQDDYPFFAERLVILHEFVAAQVPDDLLTLWRDRRDVSKYWTLWAVMVYGSIGVVLGVAQIGLSIAQVLYAVRAA